MAKFQPKPAAPKSAINVRVFSADAPLQMSDVIYVSNVSLSASGNTKKVTCRLEADSKSPERFQIFLDPEAPDPVPGTKIVGATLIPAQRPVEGHDGEFEDIEAGWSEARTAADGTQLPALLYYSCYLIGREAIQKPTGGRAMGAALLTL